jgi:hypothetical protein
MIVPADLDLETADRDEIVAKLVRDGVYDRDTAEDIADMIEAGEVVT